MGQRDHLSPLELDDEIVKDVYRAAAGLVPWTQPLTMLFQQFTLRSMQLVFIDTRTGELLASEQPGHLFDEEALHATFDHIREWVRVDPHVSKTMALPIGEVYDSERSGAVTEFADTPFYREYWTAHRNRGVLSAKLTQEAEHAALLGFIRSHFHPAFSEQEGALFARYCRHFSAALAINRYVDSLRTDAMAGRSLLEASARPMLLLDAQMQLKLANPAGRSLLAAGNVLRTRDNFVTCRERDDAAILREAIARLVAPGANSDRTAVRLAVCATEPLLCTLWFLRPETTMAAFGRQPVVLLSVVTREAAAVPPDFLESLYDLTPAESRVALQLQTGAELADIARQRRVSIDTVKSQVRSIYSKVGVASRAELTGRMAQLAHP